MMVDNGLMIMGAVFSEWKQPDHCGGVVAQSVGAETFKCIWKSRYDAGAPDNIYVKGT